MLSHSARRFHSLLILPALVSLFFLAGASPVNNRRSSAMSRSANAYQPSRPSMTESHVLVDTDFCYDPVLNTSIATSAYLDGGDGSHPRALPLTYSGTNVTLSFTRPVSRVTIAIMASQPQQVVVSSDNGQSIIANLEPWEIFGNPQSPKADIYFPDPGTTSVTLTSVNPDLPFWFELGVQGEVGPFLFGISSGSFIYGAIFGIIVCFVKRLRSTQ